MAQSVPPTMNPLPRARPPVFILIFFALFGCAGVAILVFLWVRMDTFGGPPLIFRIMGSLIALMFIAMGFGMPLSALKAARTGGAQAPASNRGGDSPGRPVANPTGYTCPNCGAKLGPDTDVSPSGDAKCSYCERWWNIHRTPA